MVKHISCNCKCKFNSTTCNPNQKWNNETYHCDCRNFSASKKKIIVGIIAHVFVGIVDDSKIVCDEIIYAIDSQWDSQWYAMDS